MQNFLTPDRAVSRVGGRSYKAYIVSVWRSDAGGFLEARWYAILLAQMPLRVPPIFDTFKVKTRPQGGSRRREF